MAPEPVTPAHVVAQHIPFKSMNESGWCPCDETNPFEFETFKEWAAHVIAAIREAFTITTVEQLDALPDQVVIMTTNGPWQKDVGGYLDGEPWMPGGYDVGYNSSRVAEELPAQIIWHPEWESK